MATAQAALFDSGKGGGAAIGEREQLSNVIMRIDPAETPLYSNAKKEVTKGVFVEWQVQDLAAAAENAVNEGSDANYAAPTATTRVGNYHQIGQKAVSVSDTLDVTDKAGRDREVAYQKSLKGLELRKDIEKSLVSDRARSGTDPRYAGTLSSWITNASISTAGTTSALPTGDGTDIPTYGGNDRALTLALIDEAMIAAYNDGGQPDILVVSPTNKVNFSDLSSGSVATNQINYTAPREAAIIGSVSLYLSDFGELLVVINRAMANDRAFLVDSDHYSMCSLTGRNFKVNTIGKTGDSTQFQIVNEWSMKITPKAHGAVYDLSGS